MAKNSFVAKVTLKIGFLVASKAGGLFPNFQYGSWSIWLLKCLLLLELQHFDILVFLTNPSPTEFQVGYLASFHHLLAIDDFKCLSMESLRKSIQLILVFLNTQFFVQHFLNMHW